MAQINQNDVIELIEQSRLALAELKGLVDTDKFDDLNSQIQDHVSALSDIYRGADSDGNHARAVVENSSELRAIAEVFEIAKAEMPNGAATPEIDKTVEALDGMVNAGAALEYDAQTDIFLAITDQAYEANQQAFVPIVELTKELMGQGGLELDSLKGAVTELSVGNVEFNSLATTGDTPSDQIQGEMLSEQAANYGAVADALEKVLEQQGDNLSAAQKVQIENLMEQALDFENTYGADADFYREYQIELSGMDTGDGIDYAQYEAYFRAGAMKEPITQEFTTASADNTNTPAPDVGVGVDRTLPNPVV